MFISEFMDWTDKINNHKHNIQTTNRSSNSQVDTFIYTLSVRHDVCIRMNLESCLIIIVIIFIFLFSSTLTLVLMMMLQVDDASDIYLNILWTNVYFSSRPINAFIHHHSRFFPFQFITQPYCHNLKQRICIFLK